MAKKKPSEKKSKKKDGNSQRSDAIDYDRILKETTTRTSSSPPASSAQTPEQALFVSINGRPIMQQQHREMSALSIMSESAPPVAPPELQRGGRIAFPGAYHGGAGNHHRTVGDFDDDDTCWVPHEGCTAVSEEDGSSSMYLVPGASVVRENSFQHNNYDNNIIMEQVTTLPLAVAESIPEHLVGGGNGNNESNNEKKNKREKTKSDESNKNDDGNRYFQGKRGLLLMCIVVFCLLLIAGLLGGIFYVVIDRNIDNDNNDASSKEKTSNLPSGEAQFDASSVYSSEDNSYWIHPPRPPKR